MNVTKAIIPVAGWGTRMLPITKSIEKCMLPVGTRPVIDYIVQDLIKGGIKDIIFVVGEQSTQVQSYYRTNIPLNDYLKRNGKSDKLSLVAPLAGVDTHFIVQSSGGGYGTSVPVGLANDYIGEGESAIVVMGDQFFYREDGGSNTSDLITLARESKVSAALFGNVVPMELTHQFGIIEKDDNDNFVRILEKPSQGETTSNLNNSSFYLLDKELFELARTTPVNPKRGEFELTDAINEYVNRGKRLVVGTVKGEYLECGSVDGWLAANNRIVGKK